VQGERFPRYTYGQHFPLRSYTGCNGHVQMTALVLAAGRGARLRPLTESRNKCVLPVAGRPAIAYSLDRAVAIGADRIVVVIGYRAGDVIEAVGSCHGPLRVRYVYQPECLGVVHAIAAARQSLNDGAIFLSPGDEILIEPRLAAMREAFESDPTILGVCGVVPATDPDRVRRTGSCLLHNSILDLLPSTPRNPTSGEQELADLFQHAVDTGHRLPTFDVADECFDLDTPDDIRQIPLAVARGIVSV
jgi:NDP-sugar pyrophosphorylase family protein